MWNVGNSLETVSDNRDENASANGQKFVTLFVKILPLYLSLMKKTFENPLSKKLLSEIDSNFFMKRKLSTKEWCKQQQQ